MWGIFPFGSSLLAILVFLIPEGKRRPEERWRENGSEFSAAEDEIAEDELAQDEVDTRRVAS
jgi:hypothetical protein